MKVYHPEGSHQMLMVAPASQIPEADRPSDWLDQDGKPRRFDIQFANGVAEVDDKMGKYLIEKGYANKTNLKRAFRQLVH